MKYCKDKKGFTLVELIAVIILVGVVALISIPTVNYVVTKSKERARTAQIKTIESAAKSWVSENLESLDKSKSLYIKVEDLIIESYLDEEVIVDPLNTDESLDQCVVVLYNEQYKTYDYKYTSCTDETVPIASINEEEITTSSISVTLNCVEEESLIVKHEFSIDNGLTWIDQGQTNKYEFKKLVHDKTYGIMGRCTNSLDLNATALKTIKTVTIEPPVISQESQTPSNGTYATSRTIKITYPLGYTNEYSLDLGVTWNAYTTPLFFTENGIVIARVNDGINYISSSSYTVTNIDTTKPTASLTSATITSKSVNLVATCVDDESGITKYEFSKDNGTTYVNNNTTKTYTFNNLTTGTYTFKVRCTNGIGYKEVATSIRTTSAIAAPTYSIAPSGYATSKTVTITYPSGYTKEYSIDGGTTWTSYTAPIVFNNNGTVIARVNDGVNYVTGSSFTVTNIDTTVPTGSLASTTVTSKSVLLTATCADAQSGITKYEFSKDNGTTYINNNTTNTYTFNSLTTGTYSFRVRCTNGSGLTVVASRSQATSAITAPTYSVTPSGYATSKTVTITYPSGYTNEYSTDGGTTWTSYTAPIVFNNNGTVIARVNDGVNYVTGSSFTVTNIDTTAPTGSLASTTVTSKSVLLTATCADAQSGITKYEFSKDNGTTYINNNTTNTYTFNSLTTGTYSFRVRCTNGSGLTVVASISQATSTITVPTYSVNPSGYAVSKTVTITYPSGYTNEYSTDGGTTWNTYTTPIVFTDNGTIIARVTDGINYVNGSSFTVNQIDKTVPTITAKSQLNIIVNGTSSLLSSYFDSVFGPTGGTVTCAVNSTALTNTNQLTLGINVVTCTATGANGLIATASTTFKHTYSGTLACSGGRTLSGGNCVYTYSNNESMCGCAAYRSCATSACGYNSCANSACGVASYNSCQNSSCTCAVYSCTLYKSCANFACGSTAGSYACTATRPSNTATTTYSCTYKAGQYCCTRQNANTCRTSACGTETVSGSACNSASSKYCSTYNSCPNSACGVASYNSCATSACGNKTCVSSACGCQTGGTCTKTENAYAYYSCPTSGTNTSNGAAISATASGATCSF